VFAFRPACTVLQVALEGAVNAKLAASSLARGELPQGDLIPWTMGQQYQVSTGSTLAMGWVVWCLGFSVQNMGFRL
jgi:tRNA(Met) C34 N-acetyltransferase TmcA